MQQQVFQGFQRTYGNAPQVVTRAPGRLEILGNHTDYNEGVVLSVAVDRAIWVAAARRDGTTCRIKDLRDNSSRFFDLRKLETPEPRDWANYIKGIVVELQRRGLQVPAFDAVLLGTVPLSAGMSSSAALEISTAYAIGRLAGIELPWQEWAKVGQAAENNYVGARTGLLDQFSSIMGRKGQLVFSDFRTLQVQNVPLPAGTTLVVANSMVKHHLTNEYNERRSRCEEAVAVAQTKMPNVKALRDLTRGQLETLRNDMPEMAYRRALHVVGENERVFAGIEALEAQDLETFGRLMSESHTSSRVNFENSCPELDALVEIGKQLPGVLGGRLSGGGFGGITVHLVREDQAQHAAQRFVEEYKAKTGNTCETMICHAADGAEVLQG